MPIMETTPMTPIIFPHTRIGPNCLSDLLAVFDRIILKRPSADGLPPHLAAAFGAGRLDISWPANDDGLDLQRLSSDYRQWLEDNRGAEIRVRHLQRGSLPLVDETSVARLRTLIQSERDGKILGGIDDSRLMAQLFLVAADAWAASETELQSEMAGHAEKERALFEHLHGDASELALFPTAPGLTPDVDPCALMTSQWISSWCRIVLEAPPIPRVWITFSDAVVSWMLEVFDGMRKIGEMPRHALGDGGFDRRLDRLLQDAARCGDAANGGGRIISDDDEDGESPVLTFYQVCGVSPEAAAYRLQPRAARPPVAASSDDTHHLVLLQWHGK